MRSLTSVDLAFSWLEAPKHLPRRWVTVLGPYVDPEQSSIVSARLIFPGADPLLEEFLAFAEQQAVRAAGSGGILGRLKRGDSSRPLMRAVRRWNEYDFADLQGYAVVQLLLDRTVALAPPLSQYYRVEIEQTPNCHRCGQVQLRQTNPLRVTGQRRQPSDEIVATDNHELIVSQRLRQFWEEAVGAERPQFLPVETGRDSQSLWQATPQGTVRVHTPPTPIQERDRCPACGRPLTVALSTAPDSDLFGPDRSTVYEQEALLTLRAEPLPAGDLWVTDVQEGRIGELKEVLQRFEDYPDPFYIRSSRPFWLISQRLLWLLNDHVASGWRCRPVNRPA